MKTFCSWIPNVIGRLSFSISGLGSHPSRVVFGSNLRDGGRYFAGYQRRDLSDTTIPLLGRVGAVKRFIDKHFFGKTGDFYFVCLMKKSENSEYIKGKVFVFDRSDWLAIMEPFKNKMIKVKSMDRSDTILSKQFERIIGSTESFFSSNFRLDRNGIIKISLNSSVEPMYFEDQNFDSEHACAAQVFFFLRDIFHTHKFHSPDTDTILDVYPENGDWMKSIEYALARKAIALRRQDTQLSLRRSIGIVSYLRSFQKICPDVTSTQTIPFSTDEFVDSLNASFQVKDLLEQHSWSSYFIRLKEEFLKWFSLSVALLIFFVDPAKLRNNSIFSDSLFQYIPDLSRFEFLTIIIILSSGVILTFKLLIDNVNGFRDDIAANLITSTLPISKNAAVGFLFLSAIGVAIFAFYLMKYIFFRLLSGT